MGIRLNLADPYEGAVPVHLSDLGDTFSRADGPVVGSALESGVATWGVYIGSSGNDGPAVNGGMIRAGTAQTAARGAAVPTGWPNRDIVARIGALGAAKDLAIIINANSSTERANLTLSGGTYRISQQGGSNPGTRLSTSIVPAVGDVILLEVRGTTVDLYVNGAHAGTAAIDANTLQHVGVITYPSDLVSGLEYLLIYRR